MTAISGATTQASRVLRSRSRDVASFGSPVIVRWYISRM